MFVEACKETLLILSCLNSCLKVWMYVIFRAGNMHKCIKTAGLRQDEEKDSPGGSCVACLQICSVYFFSVGVNIHSPLLAKKSMFQFSDRFTKSIFRLLIYCNIPSYKKSECC